MTLAPDTFAVRSRSLKLGLGLVLAAAMLTGCSPASYAWLAVALIDGEPVVLLNTCDRGGARIYVYEQEPATPAPTRSTPKASPTDLRGVEITSPYWSIQAAKPDAVNVIPMFAAPSGWEVLRATLSTLDPGASYRADAQVDNVYRINNVHFTVEMLTSLNSDEVLYAPNPPETATITRAEFNQKYESECADLRDN